MGIAQTKNNMIGQGNKGWPANPLKSIINIRECSALKAIIKYRTLYLMILPGLLFFIIFSYGPLYGLQLAFKKFMYNKGILGSPWVGLSNFNYILYDTDFWNALKNTVIISFGKILFCFPVPIILSLLLNELRSLKFKRFIQSILYVPHFFSWVIISGIFFSLLSSTSGVISKIFIEYFGVKMPNILGNPDYFRTIIYFTNIWKSAGWGTIVYLAAVSGINPEIYESAQIDGANRLRQALNITLPSIKFAIIMLLILDIGHMMNAGFDQIFNFYSPSTYSVGDIIDTFVYRMGIVNSSFGVSTAVGFFKSVVNCALLLTANRTVKMLGEEGIY